GRRRCRGQRLCIPDGGDPLSARGGALRDLRVFAISAYPDTSSIENEFIDKLKIRGLLQSLLLWVMLLQKEQKLEPLLEVFSGHVPEGVCFSGVLFANGLGSKESFERWIKCMLHLLSWYWPHTPVIEPCSYEWSQSSLSDRKQQLID